MKSMPPRAPLDLGELDSGADFGGTGDGGGNRCFAHALMRNRSFEIRK